MRDSTLFVRGLYLIILVGVLVVFLAASLSAQVYIPPPRVASMSAMSVHAPPTGLYPLTPAGPSPVQYVYDLPPGCTSTLVNGVWYNSCAENYYRPYYQGPDVVYVPVQMPQ